MHPALVVVDPAAESPVSLQEAKDQLRITHSAEDAHIAGLIRAATAWAETYTGRGLVTQTVEYAIDRFPDNGESVTASDYLSRVGRHALPHSPLARRLSRYARDGAIYLPGGNVRSVVRIDYTDPDGAAQQLTGPSSDPAGTDYQEDLTDDEHAYVFPPRNGYWPSVQSDTVKAVTIRYVIGYGASVDDIPDDIKHAIKMRVADMYMFRGSADAGNRSAYFEAAESLLDPHCILVF